MLGINNRDLQTFKVDIRNNAVIMESAAGRHALERGFIFAGESGIFTPQDVSFVQVIFCSMKQDLQYICSDDRCASLRHNLKNFSYCMLLLLKL